MAKKPRAMLDLHKLREDDRIKIIVEQCKKGEVVGVLIDAVESKVQRYIEKVQKMCPGIYVVERVGGPVANVVTVKFAYRELKN